MPLCRPGCLGCSFCDEYISGFEIKMNEKKKEESRRKAGLPTLRVTLEEILKYQTRI